MCDPVTLAIAAGSAALSAGGTYMTAQSSYNNQKTAAYQQAQQRGQIASELLGKQAGLFDEGADFAKDGNAQALKLQQVGYDDLAGQQSKSFGDQLGITNDTFNGDLSATNGLMTSQRQLRQQRLADAQATEAQKIDGFNKIDQDRADENQRQFGFADQGDAMAKALPGMIGVDAQRTDAGSAATSRAALVARALAGSGGGPTFSDAADPTVRQSFANGLAGADGYVQSIAAPSEQAGGMADASANASSALKNFDANVAGLKTKAGLSKAALDPQIAAEQARIGALDVTQSGDLRLNDIAGQNAQDRADFATMLSDQEGQAKSSAAANFSSKKAQSAKDYYANAGQSLDTFNNDRLASNNSFADALTQIYNQRIGNTTVQAKPASAWGAVLSGIGQAGMSLAGSGAFGGGGDPLGLAKSVKTMSPGQLSAARAAFTPNYITPPVGF